MLTELYGSELEKKRHFEVLKKLKGDLRCQEEEIISLYEEVLSKIKVKARISLYLPILAGKTVRDIYRRNSGSCVTLECRNNEFLAMLMHDFKSPLSVIAGYTDLIVARKEKTDEELLRMIEAIQHAIGRLIDMADDFLVVSVSDAEVIKHSIAPGDLSRVLADILTEFAPSAEKKGISLTLSMPILPPVSFNQKYIERAVANLIQNALNYTASGGSVEIKADAPEVGSEVIVSVRDTGIGIAEEDIDRIFDKYYRARRNACIKGSGLGLAIVKAVAEAHGGRVTVESKPGQGSTFKIFIPAIAQS